MAVRERCGVSVCDADVVKVIVGGDDYKEVEKHAELAQIGGVSWVRDRKARRSALGEDQMVGLLGHYAASDYLFEDPEPFREARQAANANPYDGDGGVDLPPDIDVKGSKIRSSRKRLSDYRLPVRPTEMHRDHRYVLALVSTGSGVALVRLVGWITGRGFPRSVCADITDPLCGAYIVKASHLYPMRDLKMLVQYASAQWKAR